MPEIVRYILQGVVWVVFALALGYLSSAPAYRHFPADKALLKLSFSHGGARQVACRKRSREELLKLAPNMRKPEDCPRRRVDLVIDVALDGTPLFRGDLPPTGLSGDGPSYIYRRFRVPVGAHVLDLRLRDSRRTDGGFDHSAHLDLDLAAGQSVAIDFRPDRGGFIIR